jgi:hypothetical protein
MDLFTGSSDKQDRYVRMYRYRAAKTFDDWRSRWRKNRRQSTRLTRQSMPAEAFNDAYKSTGEHNRCLNIGPAYSVQWDVDSVICQPSLVPKPWETKTGNNGGKTGVSSSCRANDGYEPRHSPRALSASTFLASQLAPRKQQVVKQDHYRHAKVPRGRLLATRRG